MGATRGVNVILIRKRREEWERRGVDAAWLDERGAYPTLRWEEVIA